MAILQISKIIHRTGANINLPQLDTGEIGFATDERRVFIGNDPILFPPDGPGLTTQTELLTDSSTLDFSRLSNSDDSTMFLAGISDGELFVASNVGGVMTWTNRGGETGGLIDLGDIVNVKITGTAFNGAVLQTDGTGNLTWTTNGVLKYDIANVSLAAEAVVTTTETHLLATGTMVTILDVAGMTEIAINGNPYGTSRYWIERLSNTTFQLYSDDTLSTPVNSSGWTAADPNTGYVLGTIASYGSATAGGSNTNIQFNDAGGFLGSSNLTFNKTTNNVALTGNIIISTGKVYGNTNGAHNGTIGATTPNTGAFTTITAGNINVTSNVVAAMISANTNGTGNNFKVGDDAWIGDINVTNTLRIKGQQDPANGYVVFGTGDTTGKLGRSGTGALTYTGDFTATGNVTANKVKLAAWSLFANVDGLFANDGTTTYSINLTEL